MSIWDEHWDDRLVDRAMMITYAPWFAMKGKAVIWRILGFTLGWFWIIPCLIVLAFPTMMLNIVRSVWRDFAEPGDL